MPRKKTATPDEQALMEQSVAESVTDNSVLPETEDEISASDENPNVEAAPVAEDTSEDAGDVEDAASADAGADMGDIPVANSEPADHEAPDDIGTDTQEESSYNDLLQELGDSSGSGVDTPLVLESETPTYEEEAFSSDDLLLLSEESNDADAPATEPANESPSPPPTANRRRERVLTIDARSEVQTEEEREAIIWHEIQNSHRTRRILTGTLDGVEKTESGLTLAVVNYKGFRVAIPIKEMLLHTGKMPSGREYLELMERLNSILNSRLGCEIDFIVKGYDNDTRSVVASRKEAMYRKRQTFYLDTDELGEHLIYEGRVVQARVVAVAEKVIRVEVFGVECSIVARGLSWEWIGNARDHFSVGDRILVRVLKINRTDLEHLSIRVDVRSVSATNSHDNLKKCLPQCRYAGRVTDVRNGVVFIRLNNGVNAIAHSCYDLRAPGKKDDVSFAVTRLDEEQGVAIGIITRIIKQNL